MELKAAVMPHLEAYKEDLTVHDRQSLKENPGVPFLHWTRTTGTDLQFLHPADSDYYPPAGQTARFLFGEADRDHFLNSIAVFARYNRDKRENGKLVLYLDGSKLRTIDTEKAVRIAESHCCDVRRTWNPVRRPEYAY
jgi:hypothetical protein